MDQPWLWVLAVAAVAAMAVWARSARFRQRQLRRTEAGGGDPDLVALVRSDLRKDTLAAGMWGLVAVTAVIMSFRSTTNDTVLLLVLIVPAVISVVLGRNFVAEARVAQARAELERRAQEVLDQEELAPRRWAARLAPEDLPDVTGFEIGRVYQAGSGLMAGDFYDLVRLSPTRLAAVIGDVSGHGIEPAITAFQAKYLLRVSSGSTAIRPRPSRSSTPRCRRSAARRSSSACA
jgi:hypothetical protein